MLVNSRSGSFLWRCSTGKFTFEERLVPPSKNMLAEWYTLMCLSQVNYVDSSCNVFQALFPHGIDVLRKTDFYAVSVRRNAFTVAAPQVAE